MSQSQKNFIPVSVPSITQLEIDYVTDAVESGWVSSLGKYVDLFEEDFASFCQTKHAVSCANGTVAIQLALAAYGIGAGDEVLVPDLSFIATANAVVHCGAKPVFVDIDPETLCIDADSIKAHITEKTKAIMPVHLYGHPANMQAVNSIAREHGLVVIEDAAEAHGSSCQGLPVGGLGDCGTFSFYGNKNFTTGEGGMITTNDDQFAQRCRYLRDHAMDPKKRYWHTEPGFNYRLTNIQAALGCAQLSRAEEILSARKWIFSQYQSRLSGYPELRLNRCLPGYVNSYWITCIEVETLTGAARDQLMVEMKARGVDSRPYFYPMSDMPYFEQADTPVAHRLSMRGINLPTFVGITEEQIDRVSEVFLAAWQSVRTDVKYATTR